MEQKEFDELVKTPDDLIRVIETTRKNLSNLSNYQKQYDCKKHDITDTALRLDKSVTTNTGTMLVPVARLTIPMQKKIVALAAAFLCGNPIKLSSLPVSQKEKDLLTIIERTWEDNKLDYDSKTLAKIMMSETEVAELWYTETAEPGYWKGTANETKEVIGKLRMKILSNGKGDAMYPVYSNSGDMIAFARGYSIKVQEGNEDHFDIYTAKKTYKLVKKNGIWEMGDPEINKIGKIPVIYYSQDQPEWDDVQSLIDRLEKVISNHADTNDYFVSPMVVVSGEIEGFSKKGESGKVLELKNGASADYLSWDQSPESLKLEYNNLRSLIFDMTDTPDISIEQMKALGTYSGIALKMLFLGAHLKAADKEEVFGKSIQRRINFLKAAFGRINVGLEEATTLVVKPVFEYYLPKNNQELIELLNTATGAKPTMSQQTAVKSNPLVSDVDAELKLIEKEGLNTEMEQPI